MTACGFVGTCGRNLGHHGHHGGFRTPVADAPVVRLEETRQLGDSISPREQQILAEYAMHGSYKDAAACLGIHEQTAKNHGHGILVKTGAVSMTHALWVMGWTTFPPGLGHAS